MEVAAYRLLYDSIHEFKSTARRVEADIQRLAVQHNCHDPVPAVPGRTHHDVWVSMKTVSHFNLGIALESMLKLLLIRDNVDIPVGRDGHLLVNLHDKLPATPQTQLEAAFQASRTSARPRCDLIAFVNAASPPTPQSGPPNRDVSTLRGYFEYFDEDVILWQKRYSWELAKDGRWRHYLSDISLFVALIDRVMADVERF